MISVDFGSLSEAGHRVSTAGAELSLLQRGAAELSSLGEATLEEATHEFWQRWTKTSAELQSGLESLGSGFHSASQAFQSQDRALSTAFAERLSGRS